MVITKKFNIEINNKSLFFNNFETLLLNTNERLYRPFISRRE